MHYQKPDRQQIIVFRRPPPDLAVARGDVSRWDSYHAAVSYGGFDGTISELAKVVGVDPEKIVIDPKSWDDYFWGYECWNVMVDGEVVGYTTHPTDQLIEKNI